jgi:hypothetical protein
MNKTVGFRKKESNFSFSLFWSLWWWLGSRPGCVMVLAAPSPVGPGIWNRNRKTEGDGCGLGNRCPGSGRVLTSSTTSVWSRRSSLQKNLETGVSALL